MLYHKQSFQSNAYTAISVVIVFLWATGGLS